MDDRQTWVAWRYGDTWWIGRPHTWEVIPHPGESVARALRRTLVALHVDDSDLVCRDPLDDHALRMLLRGTRTG